MLLRALAVLTAVAVAVVFGGRLADHRACQDARDGIFGIATGRTTIGMSIPHVQVIEQRCRGADALIAAAGALREIGPVQERAIGLAREATRREPDSFAAWRARAALTKGDEQREAVARARRLNPRWTGP